MAANTDGRKNNGGVRPGSGRPKKEITNNINSIYDASLTPEMLSEYFISVYQKGLIEGDYKALQFLINTRYGLPKQVIEKQSETKITVDFEDCEL